MSDDLTRRQLVRRAAFAVCAPALVHGLEGCARRISPNRGVQAVSTPEGKVVLSAQAVPELQKPGGAVVVHSSCAPRPVLVANTGTGFVALQAICPHAGCEVAWVPEDLQAECPCHGSRFAGDGSVLNPPARTSLLAYTAARDPATGDVELRLFVGDGTFPPVQGGVIALDLAQYPVLKQNRGVVLGQPEGMNGPLLVTRPDVSAPPIALSAVCTHQQCTVQPVQSGTPSSSLYCPCHGSAFDLNGKVTRDPATVDLPSFPVDWDGADGARITVGQICS